MSKIITLAACLLLVFAVIAVADEWNKRTVVTFNNSVELPGIVLPPGTYVFKLLDSMSNRNIVQVFNADETHVYATILAIPDYRLTPSDKTILSFEERPVNAPEALRGWFYPGDNFGQEFVYPKVRAKELARIEHQPVLSADVKPEEKPEALAREPVVAVTPEQREVAIEKVIEEKPVQAAPQTMPAPEPIRELPKTASPVPLIGLLGVVSLGLAGALRVFSRRSR